MAVFLEGGFTPDSAAHHAANMLVKHMEQQSESFSEGQTNWIEGPDADWIAGDVTALPSEQDDTQKRLANLANIARTPASELLGH
jgi:hypothetical protein